MLIFTLFACLLFGHFSKIYDQIIPLWNQQNLQCNFLDRKWPPPHFGNFPKKHPYLGRRSSLKFNNFASIQLQGKLRALVDPPSTGRHTSAPPHCLRPQSLIVLPRPEPWINWRITSRSCPSDFSIILKHYPCYLPQFLGSFVFSPCLLFYVRGTEQLFRILHVHQHRWL